MGLLCGFALHGRFCYFLRWRLRKFNIAPTDAASLGLAIEAAWGTSRSLAASREATGAGARRRAAGGKWMARATAVATAVGATLVVARLAISYSLPARRKNRQC